MSNIIVYVNTFLNKSETFIYQRLTHYKNYKPFVFSKNEANRDYFPLADNYSYSKRNRWFITENSFYKNIIEKEKINPLLIQAHHSVNAFKILPLARQMNIPLVTFFHGSDIYLFKDIIFKHRLRKLFKYGDLFVVTCKDMQKNVELMGCPADKIFVNYAGIDLEKFTYNSPKKRENDLFTIVLCGRFIEVKGFYYAIEAFSLLSDQDKKKLQVKFLGDGPLYSDYKNQLKDLGIERYFSFLGNLSHDKAMSEIKAADLVVVPSIHTKAGNPDSSPNVVKEAQACGVPVIASDIAGIPELLIDQKTGFLVPEKTPSIIADKIRFCLNNERNRREMGMLGRKFMEEKFDLKKQMIALESQYDRLLCR